MNLPLRPPWAGYDQWKSWDASNFARCSRPTARYFDWHLTQAHPASIQDVLEVGFGNGAFLSYARQRGYKVVGIEVQGELRERALKAGFVAVASIGEIDPGQRFDVIAAFDVLEHIAQSDLVDLLALVRDRLAPGGVFVCRVPNGGSPFGRRHQHGDITHQTTLGLSKFEQLAALARLDIIRFGEAPWYVNSRSPRKVLRHFVRIGVEWVIAFAYSLDRRELAPNLVVVMGNAPNTALADPV